MKISTLLLVMLLLVISVFSQKKNYFDKKRDYIYNTVYIDSAGDTIISEKLILRVLDRRWIAQPGLQKSIRYIYNTDTAAYKNYIDPDKYIRERNAKKYKKKGVFPLSKKSTTGGYQNEHYFYMHPPRTNQYRMLFHAAHPRFHSRVLDKGIDTLTFNSHRLYGAGYMHQDYIYEVLGKRKFLDDSVNVYSVFADSHLVTEKEHYQNRLDFYKSTLDALFSFEYGFVKMHYEFESGVRIEFDLIEVIENEN